jgi:addiction module HigA family antidote
MTHITQIIRDDCAPPAPGKVLKERLLGRSQMTQSELAKRLGVSKPRLTMMFKGRCAVSAEIALRVERAFGISPHFWMRVRDEYELYEAQRLFGSILAQLPAGDEQEPTRTNPLMGESQVAA